MNDYPTPVSRRSGCKVGWYTYETLADADAASAVARTRAAEMASRGYDFGYCVPGEIATRADGLYVVTVP